MELLKEAQHPQKAKKTYECPGMSPGGGEYLTTPAGLEPHSGSPDWASAVLQRKKTE